MESFFNSFINLDKSLLVLVNTTFSNSIFDHLFPFITDLHKNAWFLFPFCLLFFGLFLRQHGFKKGVALFLVLLACQATTDFSGNHFFKRTVQRSRPADAGIKPLTVRSSFGGFSFISNHAANTMAFANYCGYFLPQTKFITLTLAILIGYSRIYNGVHYPSDVLFGALFGFLISSLFIRFGKWLISRLSKVPMRSSGGDA